MSKVLDYYEKACGMWNSYLAMVEKPPLTVEEFIAEGFVLVDFGPSEGVVKLGSGITIDTNSNFLDVRGKDGTGFSISDIGQSWSIRNPALADQDR